MTKISFRYRTWVLSVVLLAVGSLSGCASNPATLDIYFVDVEGGQATLIVTPDDETLLVDVGYPGKGRSDPTPGDPSVARDAQRIVAAATDAGVSRIDYLLITHFHGDHFGGAMELAQLMPIGTILDHGTEMAESLGSPRSVDMIQAYKKTREQSNYVVPKVGDRLPLENIDVTIVSSTGSVLASPMDGAGAENSTCNGPVSTPSETSENPRSTGFLLRYGDFRFLDLGDLAGQPLYDLACPINRVGQIDVYLVPHHGLADSADPATLAAFRPRIAVLNNGATKGGAAPIFDLLRETDGLEDVWQVHLSENEGAENFPPEFIANLDTQTAHWVRISASNDGSFRVLNGRTGEWKNYEAPRE